MPRRKMVKPSVDPPIDKLTEFRCTTCRKGAKVVWEIGANKVECWNCLQPHEQAQYRRDALRQDSFGESTRAALRLAEVLR